MFSSQGNRHGIAGIGWQLAAEPRLDGDGHARFGVTFDATDGDPHRRFAFCGADVDDRQVAQRHHDGAASHGQGHDGVAVLDEWRFYPRELESGVLTFQFCYPGGDLADAICGRALRLDHAGLYQLAAGDDRVPSHVAARV